MKYSVLGWLLPLTLSCNNNETNTGMSYKTTGQLEVFDSGLTMVMDTTAKAEIIAEGYDWSEGALWVESQKMLLFSDVPRNTVYKWTAEKGAETYLTPSGFTGTESKSKEPGSNGLTLDREGRLLLAQHGDRQIARMDAPLDKPEARFVSLANRYEGKRFSSPNDLVVSTSGEIYFTDPPYGLPTQSDEDSLKEIPWNGVYKIKPDGTVLLMADSITRPNGLALFPGEQQLLVASSDPAAPNWYIFDISGDSLQNGRIFFSAKERAPGMKGLPDGFRISSKGYIFASGPGGIYIFNREGKKLGLFHLDNATSNCSLSADEKILYVTNDMNILRIRLKK